MTQEGYLVLQLRGALRNWQWCQKASRFLDQHPIPRHPWAAHATLGKMRHCHRQIWWTTLLTIHGHEWKGTDNIVTYGDGLCKYVAGLWKSVPVQVLLYWSQMPRMGFSCLWNPEAHTVHPRPWSLGVQHLLSNWSTQLAPDLAQSGLLGWSCATPHILQVVTAAAWPSLWWKIPEHFSQVLGQPFQLHRLCNCALWATNVWACILLQHTLIYFGAIVTC